MPRPRITYRKLGKKPPSHARKNGTHFGEWRGNLNFKPSGGEIILDPRQPEDELLDTVIHELLHDACPYLEEYAVEVYGNHISEALWKMGWRLTKKPALPKRRK
jgi:hypothetical protein